MNGRLRFSAKTWRLLSHGSCWRAALLGVIALHASSAFAAPIPGVFNTGVDGLGAPLPGGVDDPHYAIVVDPSGLGDMVVPVDGFPIGPWIANSPVSQWIGPNDGNDANGPPGDYVYEMRFDMTGLDPNNAFIGGIWGTDDGGPAVLLNSIGVPNPPTVGFGGLVRFGVSADAATGAGGGFAPGINTLSFVVSNGGVDPNPSGLRVDEIYSQAAPAGSIRIPGLFPTGVDAAGVPLPDLSNDPHYAGVAPGPIPANVTIPADGYPIGVSFPQGPWVNNTGSSRWIASGNTNDGDGPPVVYYYETTFDMTGLDPSTAVITGLWSADNVGVDILLNGVPTGNPQIGSFPTLNSPFEVSAALGDVFLPGINTLTFVVDNLPPNDNPVGLRVEGVVAWAAPIPEPSTWILAATGLGLLAAGRRKKAGRA